MNEYTVAELALQAVAVLTPLVRKFGSKFAEESGKQAADSAKSLYKAIATKFSSVKSARKTLSDFEKNPTDRESQGRLQASLTRNLNQDPEFLQLIARLVRESDGSERRTSLVGGSGALASEGGVAAGEGGVAIGGDVHGDINVRN